MKNGWFHTLVPLFYGPKGRRLSAEVLFSVGIALLVSLLIFDIKVPGEAPFFVPYSRNFAAFVLAALAAYVVLRRFVRKCEVMDREEKQARFGYGNYRPGFVVWLVLLVWGYPLTRLGLESVLYIGMHPYTEVPFLAHYQHRYYKVCPRYGPCHLRNERYFELDPENGHFEGKLIVTEDPIFRSPEALAACEQRAEELLETEAHEYFCPLAEEPWITRTTEEGGVFDPERVQGYRLLLSGRKNALRIDVTSAALEDGECRSLAYYRKEAAQ